MNTGVASERVAQNIRRRRRYLGLTQAEVGKRVGEIIDGSEWSKATWSTIETANRRSLRRLDPDELTAIATALETSVAALFGETEDPEVLLISTVRSVLTRLEDQLTAAKQPDVLEYEFDDGSGVRITTDGIRLLHRG